MTDAQREAILNRFSRLYLQSSYLEDKIDLERLAGNIDEVIFLDNEDDKILAKMDGMAEVLEILGYCLCFDPRKGDSVLIRL